MGALVREIREQGDRIVRAIEKASAEQTASREEMGRSVLEQGAALLRAALDEGTGRAAVVDQGTGRTVIMEPPVANDAGRAELRDEPPESSRR
ncbi:MAG: hypothetical protein QM820_54325 [Minicystis sp.]